MNELLQKHGCANVFTVPEGLRELMADITREVLRDQPSEINNYISNYLSVLLITREHGILAVRILDDLCDCRPSVSEHLLQLGVDKNQASVMSEVIREEVQNFEPVEGKETIKETQILKKILQRIPLDEDMSARVCQVARNAYRDYWYKKKLMEKNIKVHPDEPWEIAAERTLELYKRTKPSYSELNRASEKIQAAYRGYYVRRNVLRHLKPKKKQRPKVGLPGPPVDIAGSRDIDLGPVIDIKVCEDDVAGMFGEHATEQLGLKYDPQKTITHVDDQATDLPKCESHVSRPQSRVIGMTPKTQVSHSHIEMADPPHIAIVPAPAQELVKDIQVPQKYRGVSLVLPSPQASNIMSQPPTKEPSQAKISFAESSPHIIQEEWPETLEEVREPMVYGDEVPEDIVSDTDTAVTASVPSSDPNTANTTDVEDADEVIEGEDL